MVWGFQNGEKPGRAVVLFAFQWFARVSSNGGLFKNRRMTERGMPFCSVLCWSRNPLNCDRSVGLRVDNKRFGSIRFSCSSPHSLTSCLFPVLSRSLPVQVVDKWRWGDEIERRIQTCVIDDQPVHGQELAGKARTAIVRRLASYTLIPSALSERFFLVVHTRSLPSFPFHSTFALHFNLSWTGSIAE